MDSSADTARTASGWADFLIRRVTPALIGFVCFLGLWQLVVVTFNFHPVTLPPPKAVAETIIAEREALFEGFLTTGAAALLGLLISVVVGFLIAMLFSQSRWIRSAGYPYVVFLQTVPIVAIAPLLITWFGYGFRTVVMVSTIISLFPIVSNVTTGLLEVDENLKSFFQLRSATRLQTLFKLRIPNSVSQLVSGMRISAGLAVIGAIVGEVFVGANALGFSGLGTIMTGWQNMAKTDAIIATIFVSTLLGLATLGLVNALERFCLRKWSQSESSSFE